MKKIGLVTCLVEGILLPQFLLQDYIQWEAVAFISFYTTDRVKTDTNSVSEKLPFEVVAGKYQAV